MAGTGTQRTPYEHPRPGNVQVKTVSAADAERRMRTGERPRGAQPGRSAYQYGSTADERTRGRLRPTGHEMGLAPDDVEWDEDYDQRPETISESIYERSQAARERRVRGQRYDQEAEFSDELRVQQENRLAEAAQQAEMMEEWEDIPTTKVRVKKKPREETSDLVKIKVTHTSFILALTSAPFWAVQVKLVFVGLIGLGIASLANNTFGLSEIAGAESLVEGLLMMGSWFATAINFVSEIFFGASVADLGLGVYIVCTLIIFTIGIASIFYAWFMYTIRAIDPMKGGAAVALFFSAGLYLVPLIQLFPWVLMYIFAVWWAHR